MPNATTRSSFFVQVVLAVAVLGAVGPGRINAAAPAAPAVVAEALAAPVLTPVAPRCAGCGFVQAIRRIEATALVPAFYEFTVRMRDGSVRTSSDTKLGPWLVGDRIILVGGASPTVR
jgi:hypothetical protein